MNNERNLVKREMMKTSVMRYMVNGDMLLPKVMMLIAVSFLMANIASAQSTLSDGLESKLAERSVAGAELGSLICEDSNGKLVLCSGDLDESVVGIATNVPYVTLNKPTDPDGSKMIFQATVSGDNGVISKGDLLMANKGGTLAHCSESNSSAAYAVALSDFDGGVGRIRVKLLSR